MSCPCTAVFESIPTEMVFGDSAHWLIKFTDCDGNAMDTTDWEMWLILRDGVDEETSTNIFRFKHTILASDDSVLGKATITINSEDSKTIPVGRYYYEFKRVLRDLSPPDVWTFSYSEKMEFDVKPGTSIIDL